MPIRILPKHQNYKALAIFKALTEKISFFSALLEQFSNLYSQKVYMTYTVRIFKQV